MANTTQIVPGGTYRVKGNSKYLADKYGTSNPTVVIEDTDKNLFGKSWMDCNSSPAAWLFGMRMGALVDARKAMIIAREAKS